MNYPIDVPSIAHMHPALANNPNILNDPVMQGVFSSKAAGDPLDIHALRESEDIIKTLSGSGLINDDVIETAKNRAHLLRETHATVEFGLQPGLAAFQQVIQGQFKQLGQQLGQQINQQQAMIHNTRIIPGDGNALAVPLVNNPVLVPDIQAFQPHGVIGTVPPQFNPNVDAYQDIDILHLIVFYNNDFGILVADQLPERKRKFRNWLMEHLL